MTNISSECYAAKKEMIKQFSAPLPVSLVS